MVPQSLQVLITTCEEDTRMFQGGQRWNSGRARVHNIVVYLQSQVIDRIPMKKT